MKNFLPIVSMIGASSLLVGLSMSPAEEKKDTFLNNINSFNNEVARYASVGNVTTTSTALNKYALSIQENLENINNEIIQPIDNMSEVENSDNEGDSKETDEIKLNNDINLEEFNQKENQISTLYSLSNDITSSCDDFCVLKENISSAIFETQNLINKVKQKEIELNSEQRMFITEQARQLKSLARTLSNITTELSFNLSDINTLMTSNNQDIDGLSLKYLIVLDNLVNGNELLQSGLSSLNLINQMFNMNTKNTPSNNQGRVLYGFKYNDNEPIIKDYYIDQNGNMIENDDSNDNENKNLEDNATPVNENNNKNIDTYKNTKLNSNLDTYNNSNLPNNIDTFFNTALLDNEFMYGNRGYGMNGMNGPVNPYTNNYNTNGINNNNNTQHIEENNNKKESTTEKKRLKIKKNIDTFKDENEPDIKTKLGNIKNSITGFFSKFKKSDLKDKVENPVYRFDSNDLNN